MIISYFKFVCCVIFIWFTCFNSIEAHAKLDRARKDIDNLSISQIYLRKAQAYQATGMLDSALLYYVQALHEVQLINDTSNQLIVRLSLAEFYRKYNQLKNSQVQLTKIEKLLNEYKPSAIFLARYYNRIAAIESELSGDIRKTIKYSLKAIEIAESVDASEIIASSYNELGFCYENLYNKSVQEGSPDKSFFNNSILYYKEALKIYQGLQYYRSQLTVIINLARIYHHDDQPLKCILYGNIGMALPDSGFKPYDKKDLYAYVGDDYVKLSRYKEALKAREVYHQLQAQYFNELYQKNYVELQAKYDVAKKEHIISDQELSLLRSEKKQILLVLSLVFVLLVSFGLTYLFRKTKQQNKKLKDLASENAFLVEEANHRTKNNLQLISALIHRELAKQPGGKTLDPLVKISSLIDAIATLHQQLYLNKDKEKIELSQFLHEVFNNLGHILEQNNIQVKLNFSPILIPNKIGVYLGILVTELIINSVKHAFAEDALNKKIGCSTSIDGVTIVLHYEDNGKGLCPDTELSLINTLCQQMEVEHTIAYKMLGFEMNVKL